MNQDVQRWRLGFRPGLDSLRGVAVILVVLAHARVGLGAGGAIGVTAFFTLSGFLITSLLLEERRDTGAIRLGSFYARRALRLLPAFLLFLGTIAFASALGDQPTLPSLRDLLGALFYVGNLTSAVHGHDTVILHTWSLSVEEQFYILWPLLVIAVLWLDRGRTRWVALVAAAMALGSAVLRVALYDGGAGIARVTYGTDTRAEGLLIGCCLAVLAHQGHIPHWGRGVGWVSLSLLVCLSPAQGAFVTLLVPTLASLLTAVAIVVLCSPAGHDWLVWRPLQWVGKRSYGLYLWHYPVIGVAAWLEGWHKVGGLLAAALFSIALTHLSWECVEVPFLNLKRRFARSVRDTSQAGVGEDWNAPSARSRLTAGTRHSGSPDLLEGRAESSTASPATPRSPSRGTTLPPGVNPL